MTKKSQQKGSPWRLDGKKALITGASSGIGLATAAELASLGADVLMVARGAIRLAAAQKDLAKKYPDVKVRAFCGDMTDTHDRYQLGASVWGELDILVNNIGTNIRKSMSHVSLDNYRHVQEVNVVTAFELCRNLFPSLRKCAPSCVVNNASVAGLTHLRTGPSYGMSKAAIIQMTRNLAVEWASKEIRVNAVAPWYIKTPLADQVLEDDRFRQDVLDRTPMGRIGEPEECARAIAFLCLPAASYITGHILTVDGGFSVYGF